MKKVLYFIAAALVLVACSSNPSDPWKQADKIVREMTKVSFPDRTVSITDFGAVPDDPNQPCHEAINLAIVTVSLQGGGTVVVPDGVFYTGPITLKSNVNLHLEDNATLLFSDDVNLFPIVHTRWEGIECYNVQPLIYAEDCENIAVTGKGILDGQASRDNWYGPLTRGYMGEDGRFVNGRNLLYAWNASETPVSERYLTRDCPARPQTINFMTCKNILLEDITIHRSPFWDIHPVLCTNVTMRRVTMDSHMGNNDGCDPESVTDMLFDECYIAIKSGRDADGRRWNVPSKNIIVRNCKMLDGHAGVAIGSEISGGFENLWVENCEMNSPHLQRIIRVKATPQRGGTVRNINVRNITVGECDLAILGIELRYGRTPSGPYPLDFRDITIENVTSQKSRYVVHVDGTDDAIGVHNITFRNCDINGVTEPELSHIVGAENVVFKNVKVNGQPYSWQPAAESAN